MGLAERADLVARLSLDDKFSRPLDNAKKKLGGFGSAVGRMGRTAAIGISAAVGVGALVVTRNVQSGLASLATLESAVSSLDAAIGQMGIGGSLERGGLSGARVAAWANEIEAAIGAAFDDKDIAQATATLIRFGKVTETNLRPAMQVMVDLATKTGSVDSAAQLLAKALADPAKAAGKLARSGVILTKAQQKQIAAMVEVGDVAGAQAYLLKELEKTTKGAAEASQGPYARSQKVLADTIEDAQRALATGLLPVLEEVRRELATELAKPETLARIKDFGMGLAAGFRGVVAMVKQIPWDQVGGVIKGVANFGQGLANAFMGLPTEAKSLMLGLLALNKLSGGAVIKVGVDLLTGAGGALFQQFLGKGSPANPMWVASVTGGVGGPPIVPTGGGLLATLTKAFLPVAIVGITGQAVLELAEALNPPGAKPSDYTRMGGTGQRGFVPPTKSNPMPVLNMAGISPDERQEHNDTQARLLFLDDRLQAIRDRTQDVKTATDRARIHTVAATRTGDAAIVAAIRQSRPVVNVQVNATSSVTRVTYQTGTTLNRYAGKLVPID